MNYQLTDINNPFDAPVFFVESCGSTMDECRLLLKKSAQHGSVLLSGFQTNGYGRIKNRVWTSDNGKNLLFTVILRYSTFSDIPSAITLKSGLAVAAAILKTEPSLENCIKIKWPNDIMINGKKVCGIVSECDGKNVLLGIGINTAQTEFPFAPNATSLSISLSMTCGKYPEQNMLLLKNVLNSLYYELQESKEELQESKESQNWNTRLNSILFLKDEHVRFSAGAAEEKKVFWGTLKAVKENGELEIICDNIVYSFASGELSFDTAQTQHTPIEKPM
ncbi:MAG: hypothetical protein Ta2F_11150 [Termitinemataceae bacterium]|nr:MAG: hypothetical protein Ta2F_11150 [Termitinemataceae bacterium]